MHLAKKSLCQQLCRSARARRADAAPPRPPDARRQRVRPSAQRRTALYWSVHRAHLEPCVCDKKATGAPMDHAAAQSSESTAMDTETCAPCEPKAAKPTPPAFFFSRGPGTYRVEEPLPVAARAKLVAALASKGHTTGAVLLRGGGAETSAAFALPVPAEAETCAEDLPFSGQFFKFGARLEGSRPRPHSRYRSSSMPTPSSTTASASIKSQAHSRARRPPIADRGWLSELFWCGSRDRACTAHTSSFIR